MLPGLPARFAPVFSDMGPNRTPRQAFAAINHTLPEGRRYEKIGEVAWPVETDVYRLP
jgi:hypothetical protein